MNKVYLIGNVVKDPELKTFGERGFLCNFSVAINESYKSNTGEWKSHTEYVDVTAWNNQAKKVCEYCKKGTTVHVDGKIRKEEYQDREGVKKYSTKVVANEITIPNIRGEKLKEEQSKDDLPF